MFGKRGMRLVFTLLSVVAFASVEAALQQDTVKGEEQPVVLLKKGDKMPDYVFKDLNGKRVVKKFPGKIRVYRSLGDMVYLLHRANSLF